VVAALLQTYEGVVIATYEGDKALYIAAVSEAALPAQIAELSAVTRMYGSAFTVTVTVNGVPAHDSAVGVTVYTASMAAFVVLNNVPEIELAAELSINP
jgi:hypothetical protein